MVDVSISGYEDFTPWLVARSGNDTPPAGHLIIRQPRADADTFEVVPTFSGYDLFINESRTATGAATSAQTRVYPSRLLISYDNYPEVFDNPTAVIDSESDSAIDVNSSDGQEITGVLPFFGEAAFGAAPQSGIVVVWKQNSVYLVDINEKRAGRNPVQRLETQGLGCIAPNSIASTYNGIAYANESGVYCLRRNQEVQYLGEFMERNWTERVSLSDLDLVQGHHYGIGRSYKLSVPISSTESLLGYLENSEVYVYNHTAEERGQLGAWSRYDNHPATGWANLARDAFFSSTSGRVFSIRNVGDETDYRDDASAVSFRLDTRPLDFGNSGIRKIIHYIIAAYRSLTSNSGTSLSYAPDMEQEFESTNAMVITPTTRISGIADFIGKNIVKLASTIHRRRVTELQVRIENATIDEPLEVAGLDFAVTPLTEKGIRQAEESNA
jgi:hypothetical protein